MSDQPETLSAILAEMRLDADILVFPTLTPDKLRTYADRIEAAVNERDRLRDIVRRFVDLFTQGMIHPAGTMARLLSDASAAIGEDAK